MESSYERYAIMSTTSTTQSHPAELCPRYHRAVELIGRRWTGAIIRTLMSGPRRFNELLGAVPGISDRLLTERLRELEAENVVRREVRPESPVRVIYELTDSGRDLGPALDQIAKWAERWIEIPEATAR